MAFLDGKEAALAEHETLSTLWKEQPGVFESVTRNLIQTAIGNGKNKDALITIQQKLDAEKEAMMKESLESLKSRFNGEGS